MESLEARRVLATVLWDGGAGTLNWHDAGNWVGDLLPGPSDDAVIEAFEAGTIISSDDVAIQSLSTSEASLQIDGGTFSTQNTSLISGNLTIQSATLSSNGQMLVGGNLQFGRVIPNGSSTQYFPGTITGTGDLTITGQLAWKLGTMAGTGTTYTEGATTITNQAYQFHGGRDNVLQRTLVNRGETTITSNRFYLGKSNSSVGGTFVNAEGGTLTIDEDGGVRSAGDGVNLLDNQGTLERGPNVAEFFVAAPFGAFVAAPFQSSGRIEVPQHTLELATGSVSQIDGPIELTGGDLLISAPLAIETGASVSGPGLIELRSSMTMNSDLSVENVQLGHVIPNGSSTQYFPGTISGTGDLTITGQLAWKLGTMAGTGTTYTEGATTITNQAYQFHGGRDNVLQRTLVNRGETTITSNRFYLGKSNSSVGGTFVNAEGGTLTIDEDGGVRSAGDGVNLLDNQGTLERGPNVAEFFVAAPFGAFVAAPFQSSGRIVVPQHTLELATGSVSQIDGPIELTGGDLLISAPVAIGAGASVSGPGLIDVRSSVTLNTNLSIENVKLGHVIPNGSSSQYFPATISGTGDLTVTGQLAWKLGTMAGTGTTYAEGATTITNQAYQFDSGRDSVLQRTFVNHGETTITSNRFYLGKSGSSVGGTFVNAEGGTLTIDEDGGVRSAGDGVNLLDNQGTLQRGPNGIGAFVAVPFQNSGEVFVDGSSLTLDKLTNEAGGRLNALKGTLTVGGALVLLDPAGISSGPAGKIIAKGHLGASSQAEVLFTPNGKLVFAGNGSSNTPQRLEVMSRDLGPVAGGFEQNFSYGNVELNSTYVMLRDNADNAPLTTREAIYIDTLQVDASSTLDLNGFSLYVRQTSIQGTIIGDYTVVGDSGPLIFNSNNPGTISQINELDEWTFFGRVGGAVSIIAEPGSTGAFGVVPPYLGGVRITLVSPDGSTLVSEESASAGQVAWLRDIELDQEGVYKVRVEANSSSAAGTGNYVVSIYDSTVDQSSLVFGQRHLGSLENPFGRDLWTFVANANDQLNFHLFATDVPGLQFDLQGPDGNVVLSDLANTSPLFTLPAAGTYTLEANSGGQGAGAFAFELTIVNAVELTLGQEAVTTLQASGATQLFRVVLDEAGPLRIQLQDSISTNRNELYVAFGAPPTRRSFGYRSIDASGDQQITIPYAQAGEWYILIYGRSTAPASPISLIASSLSRSIDGVVPQLALPKASTLLTVNGLGFLPGTRVAIVDQNNLSVPASEVSVNRPDQLSALFDLSGLGNGSYDVEVILPDNEVLRLDDGLQIQSGAVGKLETKLILPENLGRHARATLYVEYANTGLAPLPAPILTLQSADPDGSDRPLLTLDRSRVRGGFWATGFSDGVDTSVQIYADGDVAGTIQPGERLRVPVYYLGLLQPWDFSDSRIELEIRVRGSDSTAVPWDDFINEERPETVPQDAWEAISAVLVDRMGATWDQYVSTLSENASYLQRIGTEPAGVNDLFGMEFRQANGIGIVPTLAAATDAAVSSPGLTLSYGRSFGNTIAQRYRLGAFGRGWQAQAQPTLQVSADGSVSVFEAGGIVRRFQPDSRSQGRFLSVVGDLGTLRKNGDGSYELIESSGFKRAFHSDGTLNFREDTQGNRVSYTYTDGRLASMTHSSGESITLIYNAAGLIESVTDSSGWTTTFSYDAANELLLSASNPAGTTTYTYVTGQGAPSEYALRTIEDASGVVRTFEYDAQGRLTSSFVGDDQDRVRYAYDQPGRVTVSDAAGGLVRYSFDHNGRLVRQEDATGNYLSFEYDTEGNLVEVTDAFGTGQQYEWTPSRQVRSIRDQLGAEIRFVPGGPYNQPLSFIDTRGNTIRYQYDAFGNLTGRVFADHSIERFEYDGEGNLVGITNRRNQEIVRSVNTLGQLTLEEFPDGSTVSYGYDANDRLALVNDRGDVTSYTYDTADRVKRIDYPKGRWIEYAYDAVGRQTRLEDHTGHVVQYSYDGVGRLSELLDGMDTPIVSYSYDSVGRLSGETHANGTTTTYAYDVAGRIITVLNEQADGTDNSRFDYSYDTLGRRVGMQTLDGSWTYEHDATGQLIHAIFDSTNPQISDQDLIYEYDSAGNRIRTVRNGVETQYQTNHLNQITESGETTYDYDRDGNLIRQTDASGMTTYTYDVSNQLTRVVTPEGVWNYEYDAFGNRIATIVNGDRTEYLVDPTGLGNVIGIYDELGTRTSSYVHGFGLESRSDAETTYFYDFDAVGSTSGITAGDGRYANHYSYTPFGNPLLEDEQVENAFEFVGREGVMEEGNGLYFMRARYYQSGLGRFLSQDPLRLRAGDTNLYRYVFNAPHELVDPSGLQSAGNDVNGNDNNDGTDASDEDDDDSCESVPVDILGSYLTGTNSNKDCDSGGGGGMPYPFPPNAGGESGPTGDSGAANSVDPNEKLVLGGYGDPSFISTRDVIPYRIKFENLGPGSDPVPSRPATAPAQRVVVTDQLSADLDWSTLQFTEYGFGDYKIAIDRPAQYYFETLSVTVGEKEFDVEIELSFDAESGVVRAVFQSIDPTIGLPPDVLTGFLPPEDGTGNGQGYFDYQIEPLATLATGAEIRNVARISFDGQTVIATNQVAPLDPAQGTDPAKEALITIDDIAPASSVLQDTLMLSSTELKVSWSGTDDGAGIRDYTIFVAENGSTAIPWVEATSDTEAVLSVTPGATYSFYSVATDNVGNTELSPSTPDLEIVVGTAPTVVGTFVLRGLDQRSHVNELTIEFDQLVEFVPAPADAIQISHPISGEILAAAFQIDHSGGATHLDVTFLPGARVDDRGVLTDGNYRLTIDPNHVNGNGIPLVGDGSGGSYVFDFHRLAGDANGDREVNRDDMSIVIAAQGSTPTSGNWDPDADVDGDGRVSVRDRVMVLRGLGDELLTVEQGGGVVNRYDTSKNGVISPIDALHVINRLASLTADGESSTDASSDPYDVNRDGKISPLDALNIINHLAYVATLDSQSAFGEGEIPEVDAAFLQKDLLPSNLGEELTDETLSVLAKEPIQRLF